MRTHIVIDDALRAEALRLTGARTKREVVELGGGRLPWEGDPDPDCSALHDR